MKNTDKITKNKRLIIISKKQNEGNNKKQGKKMKI